MAVAVVSQNDNVGGGGKAAAPVAQKILAKYWSLKARRKSEERRRISVRKRRSSDVSLQ